MAKYNNTLEIKKRYRSLLKKDFSDIEPRAASKLGAVDVQDSQTG